MGKSHRGQEQVQLGMGVGVHRHYEQWYEDVLQELLEVFNDALSLVDIVQPRNLHQNMGFLIWAFSSQLRCAICFDLSPMIDK